MRVVAGVVPSVSVDGFLGSTPDDAILKYAFPSKFDLGIDSRGNRFDGLSRQWLRPFAQIVGSTPNFILFFLEAGKLQNWESPLSGGSGQIGKLGKPASRRKRADWKAGKTRFPEKAGNVGNWERPLLGGSGQIGILGTPASRRKRANWDIGKARFPEEAGKLGNWESPLPRPLKKVLPKKCCIFDIEQKTSYTEDLLYLRHCKKNMIVYCAPAPFSIAPAAGLFEDFNRFKT